MDRAFERQPRLNDLEPHARRAAVLETLRHAAREKMGWTGGSRDVADLVAHIDASDEAFRQVAGAVIGTATPTTKERPSPRERFTDVPAWVAAILDEFLFEWHERGREAARRTAVAAVRQGKPLVDALEHGRASGPPHAEVTTRDPDGLTNEEVLDAWREGWDDAALTRRGS